MEIDARRWHLALGSKNWHNYISFGGEITTFTIIFGHIQFFIMWHGWRNWLRWPNVEAHSHTYRRSFWGGDISLTIWPVTFFIAWHATCMGCLAEYGEAESLVGR